MPNFNILAGLEITKQFMVVWFGQVTAMSNLNLSCIELESGFGFDNNTLLFILYIPAILTIIIEIKRP